MSVFSQTTTLPLAACVSHAHAGVTSPAPLPLDINHARQKDGQVFPCTEFSAVTEQTDTRPLHARYLPDAASNNNMSIDSA